MFDRLRGLCYSVPTPTGPVWRPVWRSGRWVDISPVRAYQPIKVRFLYIVEVSHHATAEALDELEDVVASQTDSLGARWR